jgi:hypothetical protein
MKLVRFLGVAALVCGCASAKGDSPRATRETISGAGRIHGGGVRMDVAIGHSIARTPTKTQTTRLVPETAVRP